MSKITRISRIKISEDEMGILGAGGLQDLFDNSFKYILRITDEEMDFIGQNGTDDELNSLMLKDNSTFTEKRKMLNIRNKLITEFNKNKKI